MTDDVVGGDLVEPVTSDILLLEVIRLAEAESGIVEDSVLGQNRGVRVDEYIRSTHLDPAANPPHGYPWCMCFVYWAFEQAAASLGQSNPCVRTASVVAHWEKTSGRKVSAESILADHSLVRPGMVFCKSDDNHSHTGIVCQVADNGIITVEGNTNAVGSREGNAVVAGKLRPWDYVQLGYIDYSGLSSKIPSSSG